MLTGNTRKIFVSNIRSRPINIKTVDESNPVRILVGCKPIIGVRIVEYFVHSYMVDLKLYI